MLICISLLSFSPSFRITDELWNITSALYLYSTPGPAEVTWTTGTSPSSGRWLLLNQEHLEIKSRPYNLILLLALVLVLASILTNTDKVIDIHLHDTMFVIAYRHFLWLLAIVSIFFWLLYFLTGKFLKSNILSWAHVVATVLPLIVLSLGLLVNENDSSEVGAIKSDTWKNYYLDTYATALTIASIVLIFGQLFFVLNVLLGLVKRKN